MTIAASGSEFSFPRATAERCGQLPTVPQNRSTGINSQLGLPQDFHGFDVAAFAAKIRKPIAIIIT